MLYMLAYNKRHRAATVPTAQVWATCKPTRTSHHACQHDLTLCIAPAVVASEKGVVVGRLTFTEDGDPIDCKRMGVGGKAIPPNVDKVHV